MSQKLHVDFVLLCDDVRREDNGKFIIIGVYNNVIGIPELPATLVLSLVLRLMADEACEVDAEFQCLVAGEPKAFSKGRLKVAAAGPTLFRLSNFPIVDIENAGDLEIRWRVGEEKWESIYSIPVISGKKREAKTTVSTAP
jgi:hypothetical protein